MSYARFYLGDPNAPKPNRPTRLGVNILVQWEGKLLLEYRRDSDLWSLPGGGVKGTEPEEKAACRELWEETGLSLLPRELTKLRVYGERDRICAYQDGTVRRMVTILYETTLREVPRLRLSGESRELGFFTPAELKRLPIAPTHVPMVALFVNKMEKCSQNS